MPEGPEVESVRRTLSSRMTGATLSSPWVSDLKLRTPVDTADLAFADGRQVHHVRRKGKLLWMGLDDADHEGLFVRLGMSGRALLCRPDDVIEKHTHVMLDVVTAQGERWQFRYVDPRRFGEVVPYTSRRQFDAECAKLGPDPNAFTDDDRAFVVAKLQSTSRAIKDVLLDQRVTCGVGNIYASEACFVARLSPYWAGSALDDVQARRLVDAVEEVMNDAVAHGGTSFSDYVDADGKRGAHQDHLWVFLREDEPCRECGTLVERWVQGSRSTFLCPRCQPDP